MNSQQSGTFEYRGKNVG